MVQKKQREVRILDRPDSESTSENSSSTGLRQVDVGLDISTSNIGVCVLDSHTGDLVRKGYIKLTSNKFEDIYDKAEYVKKVFESFLENDQEAKRVFVEESHMKFTPGFSSAKTLFSLATFNGIVCYLAHQTFKQKPIKIGVRTARSKLKIKVDFSDKTTSNKEKVFVLVRALNPTFDWETKVATSGANKGQTVYTQQNYDMADAWVICRGGQLTTPFK